MFQQRLGGSVRRERSLSHRVVSQARAGISRENGCGTQNPQCRARGTSHLETFTKKYCWAAALFSLPRVCSPARSSTIDIAHERGDDTQASATSHSQGAPLWPARRILATGQSIFVSFDGQKFLSSRGS